MKTSTIQCHRCGEIYEFEETGNVATMPDGELENGNWHCARCLEEIEEEED